MEFFTVPCPGRGEVFIDGSSLGENKRNSELNVFQCNPGMHDISLTCRVGKHCTELQQSKEIINTNPIRPMEVPFICAS
jgi:hypothetical protein